MGDLGNKEIMAKNIKYYMSRNNIRPTDICGTLKFPMATFSDWINAKTYPRIDKIELMANYFGIEKSDLVEEKRVRIKKGVTINVLGRVAAGIPLEAIENIIDTEEITEELAKTGNFFGLQIHGDSMIPNICDGDIVIVRQQEDAENGEIVIATVNGTDATCKRLRKYKGGIELIANNPTYEPLDFSNKEIIEKPVKIIGKVIELRRKF
ncbi:MAG: repressor LexA [Lachnospiraceae bacterium]|jgi:repressor LexA|nr:repressor LexA [Lachnospiraceae bacterium]MCI8926382.1 repressor LexA [Lachnospiraceae bacterium]MCI9083937.1 repressor LexA [Lachnospiraceae bacterium]MCI9334873.1 repressor LexA [Lachnospiraceae bacterium]